MHVGRGPAPLAATALEPAEERGRWARARPEPALHAPEAPQLVCAPETPQPVRAPEAPQPVRALEAPARAYPPRVCAPAASQPEEPKQTPFILWPQHAPGGQVRCLGPSGLSATSAAALSRRRGSQRP